NWVCHARTTRPDPGPPGRDAPPVHAGRRGPRPGYGDLPRRPPLRPAEPPLASARRCAGRLPGADPRPVADRDRPPRPRARPGPDGRRDGRRAPRAPATEQPVQLRRPPPRPGHLGDLAVAGAAAG